MNSLKKQCQYFTLSIVLPCEIHMITMNTFKKVSQCALVLHNVRSCKNVNF